MNIMEDFPYGSPNTTVPKQPLPSTKMLKLETGGQPLDGPRLDWSVPRLSQLFNCTTDIS